MKTLLSTLALSTMLMVSLPTPSHSTQTFVANGHWSGNFGMDGAHGNGTQDPTTGSVHVDCSGHGMSVSISPDHKILTVNGISTLPLNGYDQSDPIQASGDFNDQ